MLQETTPTPNKKPKRNKTARKKSVKKVPSPSGSYETKIFAEKC